MNWELKRKIGEVHGTQWDFAQAIKRPEAVVSKVVRGHRVLDIAEQQRWAEALGADIAHLFGAEAGKTESHVQTAGG